MNKKNKIQYGSLYIAILLIDGEEILKGGMTLRPGTERTDEFARKANATTTTVIEKLFLYPYDKTDKISKDRAKANTKLAEDAMHEALVEAGFEPLPAKKGMRREFYKRTSNVDEVTFSWKVRKELTRTIKVR